MTIIKANGSISFDLLINKKKGFVVINSMEQSNIVLDYLYKNSKLINH